MKDSTKVANRFAGNGGSGGLFNELSFGYKYFLGKKRIIGFRHSLFFGYQLGGVGSVPGSGLIVFYPMVSIRICSLIGLTISERPKKMLNEG
ncbi:outer membrane protein family protein [Helicobacter pylori CPY1662]|nr:outer membrane protein family protein [Helicobacter pylori CPY1662]